MNLRKWLTGIPLFLYFLLLALLLQLLPGFLLSLVRAQSPDQGLAVGDAVPDVTLPRMVQYPTSTARLSDFRGKLLLLDFWATWCGTCKAEMPRLDALQRQFADSLRILLVTRDPEDKVQAYFQKWKRPDGTPYSLPSATADTALARLFPYRLVPHIVWVGPDGRVLAITGAGQVTPANIRRYLNAGTVPAITKKDIDVSRPLFTSQDLPAKGLVQYSLLLRGRISGLPSGSHLRERDGRVYGRAITNRPLLDLYHTVGFETIPGYQPTQLVLEVDDPRPLLPDTAAQDLEGWQDTNFYSLDLICPPAEADALYTHMLETLNTYSPYRGTFERRRIPCLVLRLTGSIRPFRPKGGKREMTLLPDGGQRLRNTPLVFLVNQLRSQPSFRLPVLDETGYEGRVDLDLHSPLSDLPALRRELRRYHLELVEAERELPVLVLRDKPGGQPLSGN